MGGRRRGREEKSAKRETRKWPEKSREEAASEGPKFQKNLQKEPADAASGEALWNSVWG